MNQPIAAKHHSNDHFVSTVLVGVVCLACLLAAGVGLYSSQSVKADVCGIVAQQVYGIQSTVKNDRHLIPRDIKMGVLKTADASQAFMAKHCPTEAIKPPEAEKTGDPKEILKQLIGAMAQ
jgi:hypothetical protein